MKCWQAAARTSLAWEMVLALTVLALASAGCQSGNDSGTNCGNGGCGSGVTAGSGIKWEVLSLSTNVPGHASALVSATVPANPPIRALRSNSIQQSLALGLKHSCALAHAGAYAGQVMCWGDNSAGQVGNGSSDPGPVFIPTPVSGLSTASDDIPVQIASGDAHSCALTGLGNIYCWGSNSNGQLGVDRASSPRSSSPVLVAGGVAGNGIIFSQVSAGGNQTCALSNQSVAYCWGSNASGQLGNGTTIDSSVPSQVLVGGISIPFGHITTSANHTCAAEGPDGGLFWGSVYCWGADDFGQLGNTTSAKALEGTRIYPSPVRVLKVGGDSRGLAGLELIQRVVSGTNYTCGITIYGNYYCWGDNSLDQLGIVTAGSTGHGNAMFDFSGYAHGMYSSTDFGDPPGGSGQITVSGPVPYTSGSVAFASPQIVSGSNHVCVLPTGGGCDGQDGHSACCWGSNGSGQLGPNGPSGVAPTWVGVAPGPGAGFFNQLAAGGDHTCGASSDGNIYCWGDNRYGQLGGGQGPSTPVPRLVGSGPYFPNVASAPMSPPAAGGRTPLVDCQIDPNVGVAPNNGNLSSYLFYARDVFTRATRVTEVDFEVWSDSTTLANEFALTLYSYSEASNTYTRLGETTAANIFPWTGNARVPTARFIFGGGGVPIPVPVGQAALPVVLQITQRSGITFSIGSNAIRNAGTVGCPISGREAYTSIPIQIYTE
jgi:alpha-tubulin suppressor-like RCC1 family protein